MRLFAATLLLLAVFKGSGQCPGVSVSADKNQVCAPAKLRFVVSNVAPGSQVQWDFGKGPILGSDTAYEFFLSPQNVDVRVSIISPDKSTCTFVQKSVAVIRQLPVPVFSVSRNKLCDGPDSILLCSQNKNAIQYNWVVDGTNYYNDKSQIIHNFKTIGSKKIALYVIDSFGCRGVTEVENAVNIYADVHVDAIADITGGCVPQKVSFNPAISGNNDKIVSYEWLFPKHKQITDGNQIPDARTYISKGSYDISLKVRTDKGCEHSIIKNNYLNFGDSVKVSVLFDMKEVCVNVPVNITATSLPGEYKWQLPGSTVTDDKTKNIRRIKYTQPGYYDVSLEYNENGCLNKQYFSKAVRVKQTVADFDSKDHYHCAIPHTVHFQNLSTSTDSGNFFFTWKYYNTDTVLLKTNYRVNDSILVTQWGRYTVELIARHTNGCSDTIRKWNYMRLEPIKPGIGAIPQIGCVGQEITFINATPRSSYISPDSIYWKIYDLNDNIVKVTRENTPTYTYNKVGKYDLAIHIGNLLGCKDTLHLKDFIEIIDPKIDFRISDSFTCNGNEVNFEGNSQPSRARFNNHWEITHSSGSPAYISDTTTFKQKFEVAGDYTLQYGHNIAGGCRDSVTKPALITINGIDGNISLSGNNGCLPLKIKATCKLKYNFHKGNQSDQVTYKWIIAGPSNYIVSDNTLSEISLELLERGVYQLQLVITNSMGCSKVLYSENIYAGVIADFYLNDNKICDGTSVTAINTSQLFPSTFKWFINGKEDKRIITQGINAVIANNPEGSYTVKLVASKMGQCMDSAERSFEVIKVRAKAVVADSVLNCAPAYAQFSSESINADSLIWYFGDGNYVKTSDVAVANIYDKNSGWGQGFDVTLVAQSIEGCYDTAVYKSMVKVRGPVPQFEITNINGCEPLHVTFVNKSKDVYVSYYNFQDGSPLDSSANPVKTYTVQYFTDYQKYLPNMYAVDSIGCASVFVSPDTILVKKKPTVNTTFNKKVGCAPLVLNYSAQGNNFDRVKWLLHKDSIGNSGAGNIVIQKAGLSDIYAIAYNSLGCSDTAFEYIRVVEPPVVKIIMSDEPCLNIPYDFKAQITNDTFVSGIRWSIADGLTYKVIESSMAPYTFSSSGDKQVSLEVTDTVGCTTETLVNFVIAGPDQVDIPQIDMVTVNDNQTIEVVYPETNYARLQSLNLFRKDISSGALMSTTNQTASTYFDKVWIDETTQAYCYKMNITDRCGFKGNYGREHCNIQLKVDNNELFKLKLSWSAYTGWIENFEYQVYRQKDGGPIEQIAVLPAFTTQYLDSPLCNNFYQYFIVAVNMGKQLESRSNVVGKQVKYTFNVAETDIRNVSVMENKKLEIKFNPSVNENFGTYKITKFAVDNPAKTKTFSVNGLSFIDDEVNVSASSYIYKVKETDRCGFESNYGRIGKSILLDGAYQNYTSFLSWNSYQSWESGIEKYQIELQDNEGRFNIWKQVKATDTVAVDKELHPEIKGAFCYRVAAISGNQSDTSYSNTLCLFGPSKVHIPNAFSPNGNDLNETFKPTTLFVFTDSRVEFLDYSFSIYNRWGEQLFHTNNLNEGWDGNYMGKPVQEGSYMYTIRAAGVDNKTYKLSGSVLVIR